MRNEVNAVILSVRSHGLLIFVKQEKALVVEKTNLSQTIDFQRSLALLGRSPPKNCKNDLTIKLDGNWSSFQLAISTPPVDVIGRTIAPSARMGVAFPQIG